jgi:hypothetical protein
VVDTRCDSDNAGDGVREKKETKREWAAARPSMVFGLPLWIPISMLTMQDVVKQVYPMQTKLTVIRKSRSSSNAFWGGTGDRHQEKTEKQKKNKREPNCAPSPRHIE